MKTKIVQRFLSILSIGLSTLFLAFSFAGCAKQEEKKEIQLSSEQSKIADIIYDFRSVWEQDNIGRDCTELRIRRIKDKVILTCSYSVGNGVSMADNYTIYVAESKLEPSKIGDTGPGADVGLVVGLYSYNCYETEDVKRAIIKRLVYGLS